MQLTHTQRGTQKKVEKGLLFFFDETFLAHQKTLLIFLISKRALTFLLQKRVVVCLYLSLFLLFYCFSARGAKIYI